MAAFKQAKRSKPAPSRSTINSNLMNNSRVRKHKRQGSTSPKYNCIGFHGKENQAQDLFDPATVVNRRSARQESEKYQNILKQLPELVIDDVVIKQEEDDDDIPIPSLTASETAAVKVEPVEGINWEYLPESYHVLKREPDWTQFHATMEWLKAQCPPEFSTGYHYYPGKDVLEAPFAWTDMQIALSGIEREEFERKAAEANDLMHRFMSELQQEWNFYA